MYLTGNFPDHVPYLFRLGGGPKFIEVILPSTFLGRFYIYACFCPMNLKSFIFSALGCRLNLRRGALRDLIAILQPSLNHDLLCLLLEEVFGILSPVIENEIFKKYVILSTTVSFASNSDFKIHQFLNSSNFALLRFPRGI